MVCRMRMRKQDATVTALGARTVLVPWEVTTGPRSDWIEIADRQIEPDDEGDFLLDEAVDPDAFDAVHTFAVVQRVITLYERCLRRLGEADAWSWHWGTAPLQVRHRAGARRAARYLSGSPGVLEFFSFDSPHVEGTVHTCQSFDAVAHEAGHAILDSLRPRYLASSSTDAWALHEGFGDLTAIFALLDQLDVCEAVVAESKADLSSATYLSAIAEQFGLAFAGVDFGIRNALHDLTLDQAGSSVYRRGQVLTGAVYDWLSQRFAAAIDPRTTDPALTLHQVAASVLDRWVAALLRLPEQPPSIRQICTAWLAAEDPNLGHELQLLLSRRRLPFADHDVPALDAKASVRSDERTLINSDLHGVCGTLKAADS